MTGVAVLLVLVIFFVITIIRYQRRRIAFDSKKIRIEFNNLDKERERVAADLHDDVGASLSGIKLTLQSMKGLDAKNTLLEEKSELRIDEVMQKIRRISYNMMPRVLQRQGLDKALKELLNLMTDSTGIAVKYWYKIDSFPEEKAIHIYRISQEILNNIVKHAKATSVHFTITKVKNNLELHIRDNGAGFNKSAVLKSKAGLGLHNITARADLLKATIYLTTGPNNGVDYLIQIPVS